MRIKDYNPEANIEEIRRQKWDRIRLTRSKAAYIASFLLSQIIVIIVSLVLFLIFTFLNALDIIDLISVSPLILVILIFIEIFLALFLAINYISIRYELKSSAFKVSGDFVDIKSGNIHIIRDFIRRSERIFRLVDYDFAEMRVGFFGKIFNYGQIIIKSREPNFQGLVLSSVKRPEYILRIIQDMIDTSSGDNLIDPEQRSKQKSQNGSVVNRRNSEFFYPEGDDED